ncbi:MAG: IS982 family transposase [Acidimicrobiales bacterium]
MTAVYVFVDDYLKAHPQQAQWRRSNHRDPAFTDAEVITVGLLQGCLGVATLKQAYQFVAANCAAAFPRLPCYAQWLARLHALSGVVGQLAQAAGDLAASGEPLFFLDSKPIPVCKPVRHGRVRLLRDEGAYFGKNSCGWFFGFKLHSVVHASGAILATVLTPANWADKDAALALAWSVDGGVALADLAYRGPELAQLLWEEAGLLLLTPAAAGKNKAQRALISGVRERVETTFSALWTRFIDRVFSRSWEGLWSAIKLKLLHHNLRLAGLIPA